MLEHVVRNQASVEVVMQLPPFKSLNKTNIKSKMSRIQLKINATELGQQHHLVKV